MSSAPGILAISTEDLRPPLVAPALLRPAFARPPPPRPSRALHAHRALVGVVLSRAPGSMDIVLSWASWLVGDHDELR